MIMPLRELLRKPSVQIVFCIIALLVLSFGPISIPRLCKQYIEVKNLVQGTRQMANETEKLQDKINKHASEFLSKDHVIATLKEVKDENKIEVGTIESKSFKPSYTVNTISDLNDCSDKYNAVKVTYNATNVTSKLEEVGKLPLLKNSIGVNFDTGDVSVTVYMGKLREEESK